MRGLFEKDLRLTLCRKQTLIIFFCSAIIMGMSMDGSFMVGYLTMLMMIVAIGTLSYDEFDNGFAFLMTLPFERKTYVREKYLFCLLMEAAAWCAGIVLYAVMNAVRHGGADIIGELPMLLSVIPVIFLSAAFMIPLLLKYGPEKSRIVLFIIFGLIAVVMVGVKRFAGVEEHPAARLTRILDSMPPAAVFAAITAVCALGAFVCYLWAVRVIEKKEF